MTRKWMLVSVLLLTVILSGLNAGKIHNRLQMKI